MATVVYTPTSNDILHQVELDMVTRKQISEPVHLVQFDDRLPILEVHLYQDDIPYACPSGSSVSVRFEKPDNKIVYNPVLGWNSDRTIIYVQVTLQMTTAYGDANAILEVKSGDKTAGSGNFTVVVERNPVQEGAIASADEVVSLASYADAAAQSAAKAGTYAQTARTAQTSAAASASTATTKASEASQSAAQAVEAKNTATAKAELAETQANLSQSYAIGTENVVRPNDKTDNSKAYAELAQALVVQAQALLEQAERIIEAHSSGGIIPVDTRTFEELPEDPQVGYMYNISNPFTSDDRFIDGEGFQYPAGTNVYWSTEEKWDVLVGNSVLGVKGAAETEYRDGYVSLSPSDIGAIPTYNPNIITQNSNWNTVVNPGSYMVQVDNIPAESTHAPVLNDKLYGTLVVYLGKSGNRTPRIVQVYFANYLNTISFAYRSCEGETWTGWQFYNTHSQNDDRYFKKDGDIVTGLAEFRGGTNVIGWQQGENIDGYLNIARIEILEAYIHYPIVLELSGRGWKHSIRCYILFADENSTNPALSSFEIDMNPPFSVVLIKRDISLWDVYVEKNGIYGVCSIYSLHADMNHRFKITYPNKAVSAINTSAAYYPTPIYAVLENNNNFINNLIAKTLRASRCYEITDWNDAVYNGHYVGNPNAENRPEDSWCFGDVTCYDQNQVRQIVYVFVKSTNVLDERNKRYERIRNNGTWGEWFLTGPLAGGTRITDWNNATQNGWYYSTKDATNKPIDEQMYYCGFVTALNASNVRQVVWRLAGGTDPTSTLNAMYERIKSNTWGPWHRKDQYLPLSGGTMTNGINNSMSTGSYINGAKGIAMFNSIAPSGSFTMLDKLNSDNGVFIDGAYQNGRVFYYISNTIKDSNSNEYTHKLVLLNENGETLFPGVILNPKGRQIFNYNSSIASSGQYVRLCRITISATYVNQPFFIKIAQRGRFGSVAIIFGNSGNNDPSLDYFKKDSHHLNIFMVKVEASKWDIYIQEMSGYDSIAVLDFEKGSYLIGVDVTWVGQHVTALPTGAIAATMDKLMVGATSTANGVAGLVPQPMAGDNSKVLFGNGTWGDLNSKAYRVYNANGNSLTYKGSATITGLMLGHPYLIMLGHPNNMNAGSVYVLSLWQSNNIGYGNASPIKEGSSANVSFEFPSLGSVKITNNSENSTIWYNIVG